MCEQCTFSQIWSHMHTILHKKDCCYTAGGYSDVTVSAGLTRVPLGAATNDISAIQVCTLKNIAGDAKSFDPLVKMRCV